MAASQADDARMVGGVNLLGAGGGAKQARGSVQPLVFGTGGKGGVPRVRIGGSLKGCQKILNGDGVSRGNCWHKEFPTPFKSLRAREQAAL
jgi:hypothetical protein